MILQRLARLAVLVPLVALLPSSAPPALAQTILGSAEPFAVLGASTVTNTATATLVAGDLGVSPGTAITNFSTSLNTIMGPGTVTDGPGLVTGTIYAGGPVAAQAHNDATIAYAALAGQACLPANNLTGFNLGGMTLGPGVYCFNTSAQLTGTLMLVGTATDVWVFQIGSTLTTATGAAVVMSGGLPGNVFWQVGSSATLGTGTAFAGNILALASITLTTGTTLTGRALALTGAVTLDANTVDADGPGAVVTVPPIPLPPGICDPRHGDGNDDNDHNGDNGKMDDNHSSTTCTSTSSTTSTSTTRSTCTTTSSTRPRVTQPWKK